MKAKPVTIRGKTYSSARAAADAFGVSISHVYKAVSAGTLDSLGLGLVGRKAHPVNVGGVTYPSAAAAASLLGVPLFYLRGWLYVDGRLRALRNARSAPAVGER